LCFNGWLCTWCSCNCNCNCKLWCICFTRHCKYKVSNVIHIYIICIFQFLYILLFILFFHYSVFSFIFNL
jgi:hypothetical protein